MTDVGLPCSRDAAGLNASPPCETSRQVVVELLNSCAVVTTPDTDSIDPRALDPNRLWAFDRDPRSGGITR